MIIPCQLLKCGACCWFMKEYSYFGFKLTDIKMPKKEQMKFNNTKRLCNICADKKRLKEIYACQALDIENNFCRGMQDSPVFDEKFSSCVKYPQCFTASCEDLRRLEKLMYGRGSKDLEEKLIKAFRRAKNFSQAKRVLDKFWRENERR